MNYETELLKAAGYTDQEIAAMSQNRKRNLALEIEMELEAINAAI
jgi:hypothetical protein